MRYLKVSLFLGVLAALLASALLELGWFRLLDLALANFLLLQAPPVHIPWVQHTLAAVFALAIAWTTVDVPRLWLKVAVAAGTLAQLITAVWVLDLYGIFFSPWASAAAAVFALSLGLLYARSPGGRRKRVVRAIFGERISPATYSSLVNSNVPLLFGGEKREATVVVCEIFNHDMLAETMPVGDYVSLNNAFLKNASDFLVEQGGYLDECDGESLRVVFGTPLPDSGHAASACRAAVALAKRLDEVNLECQRVWKQTFDFRMGVNSGELIVAAYGSRRLGAFSVAGEPVDFARRLCAINTRYQTRILLGSATYQLAEEKVEVRPIDLLHRNPEDHQPEEIYELLAPWGDLLPEDMELRDLFWKGVVYFREQRWEEAQAHFHMALRGGEGDGPLRFYLRRIEEVRGGLPVLEWNAGHA